MATAAVAFRVFRATGTSALSVTEADGPDGICEVNPSLAISTLCTVSRKKHAQPSLWFLRAYSVRDARENQRADDAKRRVTTRCGVNIEPYVASYLPNLQLSYRNLLSAKPWFEL